MPLSRKVSRHLEGTENRAGLGSDILALLIELLRRNPQAVQDQVTGLGEELAKARAKKAAASNGNPEWSDPDFTQPPQGVAQ